MRRAIGTCNEVSPGVFEVQVSKGRDPITGKRVRDCITVRGTQRDVEQAIVDAHVKGTGMAPASLTVCAFFEGVYLPRLEEQIATDEIRRRTVEGYRQKIEHFVIPLIGDMRFNKLDSYSLERLMLKVASMPVQGGSAKVSKSTVRGVYRVVSTALNRAVRWGMLPDNPMKRVAAPRVESIAPKVLSLAQANAYLDAFSDHRLEPIVVTALAAGLRRSELVALEWSDFDFKAGTVSITKGLHERGGDVWIEPPKSKNSNRVVSLPDWALEALKPHRSVGRLVGDMKPTDVSYAYRAHVRKSELPWCPLKNLRHSSATIALALGADPVALSRRMGHSSFSVTDRFYLAPGREADQIVADKMGELRTLSDAREKKAQ